MRLTRVKIRNLRCIESIEVFPKEYTSLIGPNNSGKSAVLRAFEILLNQETPASDEWRKGHQTEPIEIEADFNDLQDWERARPGVAGLTYEGRIRLRVTISLVGDSNSKTKALTKYESFRRDESIRGWPDEPSFTKLSTELQDLAKKNGIDSKKFGQKNGKEQLRQVIREHRPDLVESVGEPKWSDEGISIPAALQQALPQAQMIPAVRDAGEDGKPGARTSFGLLIKSIILPAVKGSTEYQTMMEAVRTLEKKLRGEDTEQLPGVRALEEQITERLSGLIEARATLGMDPPDAEKFIGANTTLELNDGTKTRIALQGNGLQRALVFALLEVLASQRATAEDANGGSAHSRSTILLFEEPELFIHPHLMRKLKEILQKIGQRPDWQVVVSTHSPFLVDVGEDPCSLVIHRRLEPQQPPTVTQLMTDPFQGKDAEDERSRLRALLDFHPTVCEAFFAKRVVLVEGDSEVAVLARQPDLYRLANIDLNIQRDVTVVSCDGKWTIIPIARLLMKFGVPVRVIHDLDRKRRSESELPTEGADEYCANSRIAEMVGADAVHKVDDTLEDALWDGQQRRSLKDKPYKAWKRVKELCEGRQNIDHAPKLGDIVRFAFGSSANTPDRA